ncbi:hypothetical protein MHYP_G00133230 [Metynnis hypsauchen]
MMQAMPITKFLILKIISLLSLTAKTLSNKAVQTPRELIKTVDDTAVFYCEHTMSGYDRMLWYMQSNSETQLKYLGNLFYGNPTPEEQRFRLDGDGRSKGSFSIHNLTANDSSVYFCAAYAQFHICCDHNTKTPPHT